MESIQRTVLSFALLEYGLSLGVLIQHCKNSIHLKVSSDTICVWICILTYVLGLVIANIRQVFTVEELQIAPLSSQDVPKHQIAVFLLFKHICSARLLFLLNLLNIVLRRIREKV